MDSVEAELAELRLTMKQANERFENLDKRISESRDLSGKAKCAEREDLDSGDLIDRAEKFLQWGRLKSGTLDTGNGLFTDSCWNMCLDIYLCGLKDQQVTVSAIAHSSGIPMTTAMRYINVMVEQGLLQKSSNPADHRMVFVAVSQKCQAKIEKLLFSAPI
ncbi:helix-turn-helix domain-containing protein [Sphingorhabdus sp. YGSMI21]|uniref:MarR family transcriptional regulator n=1 Tax=Sphingorhabdus sp. YGSMI21 TaxID=2077182 RepID=UPI000C1F6B8A|nr:helix-turn-helix domain-containing protein [Sphingorhabdus sp. YGSMI21]ATW04307.1 hypothetical protein CHN51_12740 [Sphingorhabdus sp. YGSMI21]